jgi:hypothetical protein
LFSTSSYSSKSNNATIENPPKIYILFGLNHTVFDTKDEKSYLEVQYFTLETIYDFRASIFYNYCFGSILKQNKKLIVDDKDATQWNIGTRFFLLSPEYSFKPRISFLYGYNHFEIIEKEVDGVKTQDINYILTKGFSLCLGCTMEQFNTKDVGFIFDTYLDPDNYQLMFNFSLYVKIYLFNTKIKQN